MEQQSSGPEPLSVIQQKVDEWFTYHSSSAEQQDKYAKLRHAAKQLAHLILENCPAGPSQDAAIMELRKSLMLANASIACGGGK